MTDSSENDSVAAACQFFEDKLAFTTGPVELSHMIEQRAKMAIIDVREAADYAEGHIPGAINIPKEKWHSPQGLRKDAPNILYCYTQTCHLAAKAALEFAKQGYPVMEMEGGFEGWEENDFEVKQ